MIASCLLTAVSLAADSTIVTYIPATIGHELLLGVISGITASLLLWFLGLFVQKSVIPWIGAQTYKGQHIGGTWILAKDDSERGDDAWAAAEVLTIVQEGHRLTGTLLLTDPSNPASRREDKILGALRDGLASFTAFASDTRQVGFTTILAQISTSGDRMTGHCVYFDRDTNVVDSGEVTDRLDTK